MYLSKLLHFLKTQLFSFSDNTELYGRTVLGFDVGPTLNQQHHATNELMVVHQRCDIWVLVSTNAIWTRSVPKKWIWTFTCNHNTICFSCLSWRCTVRQNITDAPPNNMDNLSRIHHRYGIEFCSFIYPIHWENIYNQRCYVQTWPIFQAV